MESGQQKSEVIILLKVTQILDDDQVYEILRRDNLKSFLDYQKLTRFLFQDYQYFDEKEDTCEKIWKPIEPIKIKVKKDKIFSSKKSKKNQSDSRVRKIIQFIRVIEHSDKRKSHQEISGQRLRRFLEEMSWSEITAKDYQLTHQDVYWLEIEPVKVKFLQTHNS